jgi:hypothetical protein
MVNEREKMKEHAPDYIGFRVDKKTYHKIKDAAQSVHRTVAQYCRLAVLEKLGIIDAPVE